MYARARDFVSSALFGGVSTCRQGYWLACRKLKNARAFNSLIFYFGVKKITIVSGKG